VERKTNPRSSVIHSINLPVRIQNPLAGLSKHTLLAEVKRFAETHDLVDIQPLLEKGALVAADPENYDSLPELDDQDREALSYEAAHKWSHPLKLYLTVIICSIGASVQGWDQTG
jgi:hypothetical protein